MPDLFNEKAADWDGRSLIQQLSSAIGAAIVEQVPLQESMSVMDFGAGTGLICSQIAPLVNNITAVDISDAMLSKLVAKAELEGKVEAVCQDIIELPLGKQFDLIISAMAMHHVESTAKLIQRFSEHLRPGAKVALADLDKEDGSFHPEGAEGVFHHGFDRGELQELFTNNGFTDISFLTAITVEKVGKRFPVFLVIATKDKI